MLARLDPEPGFSLDHSLLGLATTGCGRTSPGTRGAAGASVADGSAPLGRRNRGSGGGGTILELGAGSAGFAAAVPSGVARGGNAGAAA
jgi:hypothetical protein